MNKRLTLVLLILLATIPTNSVTGAPGDTIAEAVTAVLGTNNGSIAAQGGFFYFNFTGTASEFYNLTLTSAPGTDFDLSVYNQWGDYVDGRFTANNIEQLVIYGFDQYIIKIESYLGTGSFLLNISYANVMNVYMGTNNLTMHQENGEQLYIFSGNASTPYDFILNSADPSTDFDISVYDDSGIFLGGSYEVTYPDVVTARSPSGIFVIFITSITGFGPFTLDITAGGGSSNKLYLGENYGYLPAEGASIPYTFDAVVGQWYEFSLTGPVDSDFDFKVEDDTGFLLGEALGVDYPDIIQVQATTSLLIVTITSLYGYGDFTMVITEIPPPVMIDKMEFSADLKQGDQFTWNVAFDSLYDFAAGDNVTMTVNYPGDQITFNTYVFGPEPADAFTFEHNGHVDIIDFLFLFVIPTKVYRTDGSIGDMRDVLSEYFGPASNIFDEGDKIRYQDDYGEIWFDKLTGIMTYVKTTDFEYSLISSIGVPDTNTTSVPGGEGTNSTDTNSTESALPGIDLSSLPVSPIPIVSAILAIPIIRKRRKY